MNIEKYYGEKIVCQHFFPIDEVKVNSIWMDFVGNKVKIEKIEGDFIYYSYLDTDLPFLDKDNFSFQCRYYLIIEYSHDDCSNRIIIDDNLDDIMSAVLVLDNSDLSMLSDDQQKAINILLDNLWAGYY